MAKIIISEFISLDGVMEGPGPDDTFTNAGWTMPYANQQIEAFKAKELFAVGSLLLGRNTYDGFAAAWPQRSGDDFTDRVNSMPKYVVSTSLSDPTWQHTTVIADDITASVAKLKTDATEDILVFGSSTLTQFLFWEKLVDELVLLLFPVMVGEGKKLFHNGEMASFELKGCERFDTGVVALTYSVAS